VNSRTAEFKGFAAGITQMDSKNRFDEKFPFSIQTSIHRSQSPIPVVTIDGDSSDSKNGDGNEQRRHSWTSTRGESTSGNKNNGTLEYNAALEHQNTTLILKSLHCDGSRRSSTSSSPEVIEECSSGEEKEQEVDPPVDYINCKNCSLDEAEKEAIPLQNINYCFNCKHLYLQENKNQLGYQGAFDNIRRPTWQAGDPNEFNKLRVPSRPSSGRGSRRGSVELPVISEPVSEEEEGEGEGGEEEGEGEGEGYIQDGE